MNILVFIKQVADSEAKIIIKSDNKSLEIENKYTLNFFDEFAIEEAIRIKEKFKDSQITVCTYGPKRSIEALRTDDFVYVHVEASDEAGHDGDVPLKIKTIEYLDARIVKPIFEEVSKWNEPVTIAVLPDHPTPCALRTHTCDPVPFVIYHPGETPDEVTTYDEFAARKGSYGLLKGNEFMKNLIVNSNL